MYARYTKYFWLARYPTAFLVGLGTAVAVRTSVQGQFLGPITGTMASFTTNDWIANTNNILLVIGLFCATLYFVFTREQTGTWGYITTFGRYVLMASFGALYVGEAVTFNSFFIGRIDFLIRTWLHLI